MPWALWMMERLEDFWAVSHPHLPLRSAPSQAAVGADRTHHPRDVQQLLSRRKAPKPRVVRVLQAKPLLTPGPRDATLQRTVRHRVALTQTFLHARREPRESHHVFCIPDCLRSRDGSTVWQPNRLASGVGHQLAVGSPVFHKQVRILLSFVQETSPLIGVISERLLQHA